MPPLLSSSAAFCSGFQRRLDVDSIPGTALLHRHAAARENPEHRLVGGQDLGVERGNAVLDVEPQPFLVIRADHPDGDGLPVAELLVCVTAARASVILGTG